MPDGSLEALEGEGTVLIEFYLPGCPPCKRLKPKIEKFAKKTGIQVVKVNLREKRFDKVADRFGVSETPTVIIAKDGVEVARQQAPTTQRELKKLVEKAN